MSLSEYREYAVRHVAILPGVWPNGVETLIVVRRDGGVSINAVDGGFCNAEVSEDGERLVWELEGSLGWVDPWSHTAIEMVEAMVLAAMAVVSQLGGPLFNSMTQQGKDACIRAHVGKMTIRHRRHSTRDAQKRAFSVAR